MRLRETVRSLRGWDPAARRAHDAQAAGPGFGLGRCARRPGKPPRMRKRFEFVDFLAAMAFVDKMAALAEEEGHHPDFCVHYSRSTSRSGPTPSAGSRRTTSFWRRSSTGSVRVMQREASSIAGATGPDGTALAASCARDGIPVSALVRDTARGRRAAARGQAARLGRDARAAARGRLRRRRRRRQPDRASRSATSAGPTRARSSCATAASSGRARWSTRCAICRSARGC